MCIGFTQLVDSNFPSDELLLLPFVTFSCFTFWWFAKVSGMFRYFYRTLQFSSFCEFFIYSFQRFLLRLPTVDCSRWLARAICAFFPANWRKVKTYGNFPFFSELTSKTTRQSFDGWINEWRSTSRSPPGENDQLAIKFYHSEVGWRWPFVSKLRFVQNWLPIQYLPLNATAFLFLGLNYCQYSTFNWLQSALKSIHSLNSNRSLEDVWGETRFSLSPQHKRTNHSGLNSPPTNR